MPRHACTIPLPIEHELRNWKPVTASLIAHSASISPDFDKPWQTWPLFKSFSTNGHPPRAWLSSKSCGRAGIVLISAC